MQDLADLLARAAAAGEQGRLAQARDLYAAAVAQQPNHPAARFGLAQVALAQGDLQAAAQGLSELAAAPDASLRVPLAQSFTALAHALRARGARDGAVASFDQAVRLVPADARAWLDLGNACMEAAQAHADRAQAGRAAPAPGYDPLAGALSAFARAAALAPRDPAIAVARAMAARHACAFEEARTALLEIEALAGGAGFACEPMSAVALLRDPLQARAGIERHVEATLPPAIATTARPSAPAIVSTRGSRLRIGYLSSDLHDHATAHLAAGLFELHDRARFEIFAYATDRDDGSAMRTRLRRAFDHWRDVREQDDAAAAAIIAGDHLDVLVDLKGHTSGARLPILARRPAPVQIHYLGFPGTLGYPGAIDAFVADAITAPPAADREFGEPLLRLPVCYQVNDHRRVLPPATSRSEVGLPNDAVVLACFNQPYKLSAPFVNAWLAVLQEVPRTVLWLGVSHPLAQRHLRTAAQRMGVAPERLIFAPLVPQAAHLARLQCADLALDVLPYGSHTTGSDALFCGVPLLTLEATTFAGRVGASLCHAVRLPELVASSLPDYTAHLANLAGDGERRAHLRAHLAQGRAILPLFDTEGFTRAFEHALEGLADGQVPRSMSSIL